MTEHTNDRQHQSEIPGRPTGQDTSEAMTDQTVHDTAALPAPATPPTQQLAQATQRIPEGPAPEGAVHPAYGAAAARAQEEEPAAAPVHDAPTADDSDPLAPLRAPVPTTPEATTPASGPERRTTGRRQPGPDQQAPQAQPAAQAAARRGPRVGTAVWGLIVIAVGLGILAVSAGVVFDLGVALIVLLGAAGVILVVGSVISSFRRR